MPLEPAPPKYDVALSFAGEDRPYVAEVANHLKDLGISVFYDSYEESTLWGKNLFSHLQSVYRDQASFAVLFISKAYAAKVWTSHEHESAQERALHERREYILPARFDDTEVPGLRRTVVYVDLRTKTPTQLAKMIVQKVHELRSGRAPPPESKPPESPAASPPDRRTGPRAFVKYAVVLVGLAVAAGLFLSWFDLRPYQERRALRSGDPERVERAIRYFADHPTPDALDDLDEVATNEETKFVFARGEAIEAIGRIQTPEARALLVQRVARERTPGVVEDYLRALATYDLKEIREGIRAVLQHGNTQSAFVAELAGRLADPSLLQELSGFCLRRARYPADPEEVRTCWDARRVLLSSSGRLDSPSLASGDPWQRYGATQSGGKDPQGLAAKLEAEPEGFVAYGMIEAIKDVPAALGCEQTARILRRYATFDEEHLLSFRAAILELKRTALLQSCRQAASALDLLAGAMRKNVLLADTSNDLEASAQQLRSTGESPSPAVAQCPETAVPPDWSERLRKTEDTPLGISASDKGNDPRRGQFGGKSSRCGRELRAIERPRVLAQKPSTVRVDLVVTSTDGSALKGPAWFFLPFGGLSAKEQRSATFHRAGGISLDNVPFNSAVAVGALVKDRNGDWVALEFDIGTVLPSR